MSDTARMVHLPAVQRTQQRLCRADEPPWLHREVGSRMAERLALMKSKPATVMDWWASSGGARPVLARAYPQANIIAVETEAALRRHQPAAWWRRWREPTRMSEADALAQSAQLIWANMLLHHCADPGELMQRWHRMLATDGFLMLSTLGPDTLSRLRTLYAQAGWGPVHAPFIDMHDIGDMLLQSGFTGPVMDQEHLTLTWATPEAALAELRNLGLNTDPARHPGLRTPRWRQRLCDALREQASTTDGRIALGFELVYGHAFKPAPRPKLSGQTEVTLEDMRGMLRNQPARREPPP